MNKMNPIATVIAVSNRPKECMYLFANPAEIISIIPVKNRGYLVACGNILLIKSQLQYVKYYMIQRDAG